MNAFVWLMIEILLYALAAGLLILQQKHNFNLLGKIFTYIVLVSSIVIELGLTVYDFIVLERDSPFRTLKIVTVYAVMVVLYLLFRDKLNGLSKTKKNIIIISTVILCSALYLL